MEQDVTRPTVIKVSGHELDDPAFLAGLAAAVRDTQAPTVVVHGGGKEISTLQQQMGIEPRYVDGARITDSQSLALVEMVLCGTVNKRLVRALVTADVDALGLSGVDLGLVRAEKMTGLPEDMGFTGRVTAVRGDAISRLLAQGITPVIAPICLGPDSAYNVNADHVAGAVAQAIGAERVVFLTNVEGVLITGQVAAALTPGQVDELIASGVIYGGMIPKVRTALGALENGAGKAVITNLDGLRAGGGTSFWREARHGG
jgi:acetylglutamate kinase